MSRNWLRAGEKVQIIKGEYDGKEGVVMEVISNKRYSILFRGGLIIDFNKNELKSLED